MILTTIIPIISSIDTLNPRAFLNITIYFLSIGHPFDLGVKVVWEALLILWSSIGFQHMFNLAGLNLNYAKININSLVPSMRTFPWSNLRLMKNHRILKSLLLYGPSTNYTRVVSRGQYVMRKTQFSTKSWSDNDN